MVLPSLEGGQPWPAWQHFCPSSPTRISYLPSLHTATHPTQGLLRPALNRSLTRWEAEPARQELQGPGGHRAHQSRKRGAACQRAFTGGWPQDHTVGTPAFHTPSGVSEPQTHTHPEPPGDDSLSSPRAQRWPATEDTVLPPLKMQRGCSRPADGTSLSSQAAGQHECQSEGNSRHG